MSDEFAEFLGSKKTPSTEEIKKSWKEIAIQLAAITKDQVHNGDGFFSHGDGVVFIGEVQARMQYYNQEFTIYLEMVPLAPGQQWSSRPLREIIWSLKPQYAPKTTNVVWSVDDATDLTDPKQSAIQIGKGLVDFYNLWEEQKKNWTGDDEDWH